MNSRLVCRSRIWSYSSLIAQLSLFPTSVVHVLQGYLGRVDQFQLAGDCASIERVVSEVETRARNNAVALTDLDIAANQSSLKALDESAECCCLLYERDSPLSEWIPLHNSLLFPFSLPLWCFMSSICADICASQSRFSWLDSCFLNVSVTARRLSFLRAGRLALLCS